MDRDPLRLVGEEGGIIIQAKEPHEAADLFRDLDLGIDVHSANQDGCVRIYRGSLLGCNTPIMSAP